MALYGIRHDQYQNGDESGTAGLTFGPASGKPYLNRYRAHVTEQEYEEASEENLCLHWMTWEEIADQSLKDPSVFHDCLVYGCTHAVDLMLNDTLLYKDRSSIITGDGASGLLDGLKADYLSYSTGGLRTGGGPACRSRVVLNGADDYSEPRIVGEKCLLSAKNCLFSCFPETLQERIVAKVVVSDLGNDTPYTQCVTTQDKLWLFSSRELYGVQSAEGEPYERNVLLRSGEAKFGGYGMFSEKGNEAWAWFRSISGLSEVLNCHIYGGGHRTPGGNFKYYSLAPGFCLP